MDIIKEQIKAIQYDQQTTKDSQIQELRELVEFINYDRSILSSENQRLMALQNESPWKEKYFETLRLLEKEKEKNAELLKKIEEFEEGRMDFTQSCMDTGNFTDRSMRSSSGIQTERRGNCLKHANSLTKSPEKPPRGSERNVRNSNISKSPNKATIEIKNNLAKTIAQAHKSLFNTLQQKNRSISPCLSSASSRFSTPPKKLI